MVATPWGESEGLRERMLRPGPGTPPARVAENQRLRLFAAMVASVSERGYAATRVADLIAISGVSSRSFYAHFPDKRACFVASLEALLALPEVSDLDFSGMETPADAHRQFSAFAQLVSTHEPAAKMCLLESFAAGPEAARLLDAAVAKAQGAARRRLLKSPQGAAMPEELVSAGFAAVLEMVRTYLMRGEIAQLASMGPELIDFMLSYQAPTQPLRSSARPQASEPEPPEAPDNAGRALRAFEASLEECSYGETTMENVADRAGMSVRTLYANFADKEDVLTVAIDAGSAEIVAAVMPAFRRAGGIDGIRAALGAMLRLLASRPRLAHLLLIGAYEGGAAALERRADGLRPVRALLERPGTARRLHPIAGEAILAGVLGLARGRLLSSGAVSLTGLTPVCTYLALAPFVGAESASTVAGTGARGARGAKGYGDMTRSAALLRAKSVTGRVNAACTSGAKTSHELAAETGIALADVEAAVEQLRQADLLEAVEVREGAEGEEVAYANTWRVWETDPWSTLPQRERQTVSTEILNTIDADLQEALRTEYFDSRPERSLVRLPLWMDETGWQELSDELDTTLLNCMEIQRRSTARLKDDDEGVGFGARMMLLSFEVPPIEDGEEPAS